MTANLTTPTAPNERIHLLDCIRGFALLGILLMNIEYFQKPLLSMMNGFDYSQTGVDFGVAWFVFTFVQGKFYTMFSLLFGIGFIIFYDRAKQKSSHPRWLFTRRLIVLAAFGFAHLAYIWGGDILLNYAIAGLFLLFFVNKSAKSLLRWGIGIFLLPVVLFWLGALSIEAASATPEGAAALAQDNQAAMAEVNAIITTAAEAYKNGTYADVLAARSQEIGYFYTTGIFFMTPTVLGIFLIGASLARSGVATQPEQHNNTYKKLLKYGAAFGLPAALYVGFYGTQMNFLAPDFATAVAFTVTQIANFGLSFAYIAILALAIKHYKFIQQLAPAGRMALTNYLTHSIVFTSLFYGYALGMYGEIGRATATLLAIVLWLAQLPISAWWLKRFRYGPCEWLWRSLTYLQPQPFKR